MRVVQGLKELGIKELKKASSGSNQLVFDGLRTGQADGLAPGCEALTFLKNAYRRIQLRLKSIQKHHSAFKAH